MPKEKRSILRSLVVVLSKKHRNRRRIALFNPILPGANLRDRIIACCGALLGIAATGLLCHFALSSMVSVPVLIAPMGASAVLLFAVPTSPLAQPWPIIGGNTLSAVVGILVSALVPDPMLAGALAVALAIATMSMTRCLHPPGGAAALTAVLGGPAVASAGLGFALFPVAVNSILLVTAGWLFHRFSGHSYPHRPAAKPANPHRTNDVSAPARGGVTPDDVEEAIQGFGEAFDVNPDDLKDLLLKAERVALERLNAHIACSEVMSRDVVTVSADAHPDVARTKLVQHSFRTLPVVDARGTVVGAVGHEQLAKAGARVADVMEPAVFERPETPAFRLLGPLSDGRTHEVMIVDSKGTLLGVVTQTDLLMVLARAALARSEEAQKGAGLSMIPNR
ncbi:HPP family protein [Azospirillum rugosum]|uniref:CBS domain-containing membrane protein n=1 Tax=Azospirillum rugosum TaxID=416170 RepID=A0ABS4SU12_9PROT|nr:HPP family protein [Azospirillum rugosum]MBP2296045.1 CBS domain-containing membrane protein [Azospirillum rugosum]MDQ0529635.1 CBS domain-containing membrane protein [Azospirillum rugosum]